MAWVPTGSAMQNPEPWNLRAKRLSESDPPGGFERGLREGLGGGTYFYVSIYIYDFIGAYFSSHTCSPS